MNRGGVPYQMRPGFGFGPDGGMHRGGGADTLEWVIFALLVLLVLLAVTQLALLLLRPRFGRRMRFVGKHGGPPPWAAFPGGRHRGPGGADPLAVAQLRYARGEIERDAYLQLLQDLGGEPEPPPPPPG